MKPYPKLTWVEVDPDSLVFQSSVLCLDYGYTHCVFIEHPIANKIGRNQKWLCFIFVKRDHCSVLSSVRMYICAEFYPNKQIIPPTCPAIPIY